MMCMSTTLLAVSLASRYHCYTYVMDGDGGHPVLAKRSVCDKRETATSFPQNKEPDRSQSEQPAGHQDQVTCNMK
jgi:hypothetical protein